MKKHTKKLIVVLGMHRSGTSVIARSLKVMGVELGEHLLPPQEDNITGFWEDADLNAFNIEVLNVLNSDWHFLTPIQQADVETLRKNGYIQRAVELLQNKMSNIELFGFKDPRLAKLLSFWREVFSQSNLDVSYVLVFRHPLSVWKSLEKRHNLGLERSSLLWLDYIICGLVGTANERCILVDYDGFMQSPMVELERIAKELELKNDPLELKRFKSEFLDQGLRHTVYGLEDLTREKLILPLTREVYSTLLDAVANHVRLDDTRVKSKFAEWEHEFLRLTPVLSYVDKLHSQMADIVNERNRQVQTLTTMIAARDSQMQALTTQLNDITTSKAWRIVMYLRRIHRFLFHNSY